MQGEVFHLYFQGEQRGPYNLHQVNHLAKCQLIDETTLYWREGMDQWMPVGEILITRKRGKWKRVLWIIAAALAGFIGLIVLMFGNVTADAWKELTAGEYTAESAWWRARGLVREQLASNERVHFDSYNPEHSRLLDGQRADVTLRGSVTNAKGKLESARWEVKLKFDADRQAWVPFDAPLENPDPK